MFRKVGGRLRAGFFESPEPVHSGLVRVRQWRTRFRLPREFNRPRRLTFPVRPLGSRYLLAQRLCSILAPILLGRVTQHVQHRHEMKHSLYQFDLSSHPHEHLLEKLCAGFPEEEAKRLAEALSCAVYARDQDTMKRPRGIDVAHILQALRVDAQTLEAALLSDPWLRDNLEGGFVEANFGPSVANLVQKANWLNTFNEYSEEIHEQEQAELLRRMLLAVVNDVRAVLIKLAYRLQRLRLLKHQEDGVRYKIARETMDLFAPLANRLGLGQLKWELEDLAFRYIEPEEYRKLAKALATNRAERENYVRHFIELLEKELKDSGIHAKVYGRPKHLYSIWGKMQRKHVALEDLYDLLAVRVMVDKPATCYAVLGLVHGLWLHIPKEFDDYIANPKDNGYQSLHTVVVGPEGRPVEVQIRTQEMHVFAEFGVAAHWRYKEGGRQDEALDRSINSLRHLLESKEDDRGLLEDFRSELFADEIFVLTPKGLVVRLKKGATPVDFAYAIHSEVGHRCRGAKVNGHIVPLTYTLKSGEKVEILTAKQGGPSLGWLDPHMGYARTSNARSKIRQWFKQQDHERHLRAGKAILDRERQKLGMPALKEAELEELTRHFHLQRVDDLLLAIGRADISSVQLANTLKVPGFHPVAPMPVPVPARKPPAEITESGQVTVQGVRNLLMHFAHCCDPTPGTPIIGYVTLGYGVAIHRQDCANILQLP
ncbi:MAG: relA, partial [Proteobacteria bacterium]|nr:relA [Pseudomonadota bacterium]